MISLIYMYTTENTNLKEGQKRTPRSYKEATSLFIISQVGPGEGYNGRLKFYKGMYRIDQNFPKVVR